MKSLIDILKQETELFRVEFIERQIKLSEKRYLNAESRKDWTTHDYCDFFQIVPRITKDRTAKYTPNIFIFPDRFLQTIKGKQYVEMNSLTEYTKVKTLDEYLQTITKDTQSYYEQSINKLTKRLEKKNLNLENLKASTTHIGVNISTTLTDGNQTIRAFTIVAEGEIQQAHYRYLIK